MSIAYLMIGDRFHHPCRVQSQLQRIFYIPKRRFIKPYMSGRLECTPLEKRLHAAVGSVTERLIYNRRSVLLELSSIAGDGPITATVAAALKSCRCNVRIWITVALAQKMYIPSTSFPISNA